jgi:hypothetical protein
MAPRRQIQPRRTGAEQGCGEARLHLAQFVRRRDRQAGYRGDPAAHVIGRVELDSVLRMNTETMSAAPSSASMASDSDWQHCCCPAQQHGKQIERDCPEQEMLAPHKAQAIHHQAHGVTALAVLWRENRLDEADRQAGQHQQCRPGPIGVGGIVCVNEPRCRRAKHRGGLPRDRTHGDGPRQHFRRDDIGRDAAHRRADEHARNTVQHCHDEQERQSQPAARCCHGQGKCDQHIHHIGDDRHAPPFKPVCRPARHGSEEQHRQELRGPDPGQHGCRLTRAHAIVARGIINLPAQDDDHRHRGHDCRKARDPEQAVIAIGQRGLRHGGGGNGHDRVPTVMPMPSNPVPPARRRAHF